MRDDAHTDFPPASGEFDATVARDRDVKERAHELFVHGLLLHERGANRTGARSHGDARIRAVMASIEGEKTVHTSRQAPRPRRLAPMVAAAAAAAAVVLLGSWLAWSSWRKWTPAYAETLLENAVREHDQGVHVYEITMIGRWDTRWRAALAPNRRFHWQRLDKGDWGPTELGSDGKVLWIKSPTGPAMEVPLKSPEIVELTALAPVMNYTELKPFLEVLLDELDVKVVGRADTAAGATVTLGGSYRLQTEVEEERPKRKKRGWHRKHSQRRSRPDARRLFLGDAGRIEMTVLEESGRLLRIAMNQEKPGTGSFEAQRVPTPKNLAAAGIVFDPPRLHTSPQQKLLAWASRLGWNVFKRKARKRREAEKKAQQAQKAEKIPQHR